MKVFAAVLVISFVACAQALSEEQKEKVKVYKAECIKETGLAPEVAAATKKGEFPEDQKLKDFLFCVGKKCGFLNEAGEYQLDVIKSKIETEYTKEVAEQLVKACTEKTYGNGPETSYQLAKCHYEKYPEHFNH